MINLYPIRKNCKEGYIDISGKVIIEPKYDYASYFSHGIAKVGNKPITCPYTKCIDLTKANLSSSNETKELEPKNCPYSDFSRCHYVFPLWGFINDYGQYMSEPIFDFAPSDFSKDKKNNAAKANGKWGFLHFIPDSHFNILICFSIAPTFEDAEPYISEGLACVKFDKKWGYVDYEKVQNRLVSIALFAHETIIPVDGSEFFAIPPKYDDAYSFSEGLARVMVNPNVDKSGELNIHHLIDPRLQGGLWGFIDKTGAFVIKPQFDLAGNFSEGLAPVAIKRKMGYVDKTGKYAIEPRFDIADAFSEGLARVKIDEKFGYIDKNGAFAIKPVFDSATNFKDKFAIVRYNGKYNYIDREGRFLKKNNLWDKICNFLFKGNRNAAVGFDYAEEFVEELALVAKNNKFGYIDKKGKYVIKPQFKEARSFIGELAPVSINNTFNYINKKGNIIWTCDEFPYTWSHTE